MNPSYINNNPETFTGKGAYLRFTITSYSQSVENNQTTINWKLTVEGTPWVYFYAGQCIVGGVDLYPKTTGGPILTSWSAGQTIASGSHTYDHNSDGTLNLSVVIKQMFYYAYSDSRWANSYYTQTVNSSIEAPTIPRYPLLSISSYTTGLDSSSIVIANTRSGYMSQYEIRKVSDSSLVQNGSLSGVTSFTANLADLTPNTSYNGVYKVRAYANGGWGDYLTLNIGTTKALPTVSAENVGLENGATITLSSMSYLASYSIIAKANIDGTTIATRTGITSNNYELTLSSSEIIALLAKYTGTTKPKVYLEVTVMSGGISYGNTYRIYKTGTTNPTIEYTIPDTTDYLPTFPVSNVSYADINTITLALTGSSAKIIKGVSNVQFTLQPMTAKLGASGSSYAITSGGVSNSGAHTGSAINILLNGVGASAAAIQAIDSRNKITTVNKSYSSFVDYDEPSISSYNIRRRNGVEENLLIDLSGIFTVWSGLAVSNNIQYIKYRYREKGASTWSSDISLSGINYSDNVFSLSEVLTSGDYFTIGTEYEVQLIISDRLVEITSSVISISSGQPFIWKDVANKKLGLGKKPTEQLDVKENINVDGKIYCNYILQFSYEGTGKNINDYKIAGQYGFYSSNTNAPSTDISVLEVYRYSGDWVLQRWTSIVNGRTWERRYYGGTTWSSWVEDTIFNRNVEIVNTSDSTKYLKIKATDGGDSWIDFLEVGGSGNDYGFRIKYDGGSNTCYVLPINNGSEGTYIMSFGRDSGNIIKKRPIQLGAFTRSSAPTDSGIHVLDLRDTSPTPTFLGDQNVNFYFDQVLGLWKSIMHMRGWYGAYASWELAGDANSTNDDNLYFRTGISSFGDWNRIVKDSDISYSTSEVNTGTTWIDGKIIYKKTINMGQLPNNASKSVAHGISNLYQVIKIEGFAAQGTGSAVTVPLPYASNSTYLISCYNNNNGYVVIQTFMDRRVFTISYLTLYYTKS